MTARIRYTNAKVARMAAEQGIDAKCTPDGRWIVCGVEMPRRRLLTAISTGKRGDSKPFGYMDAVHDSPDILLIWQRARELGVPVTLFPNGTISIAATAPQTPHWVASDLGARLKSRRRSGAPDSWDLARRAQAVFGCNVRKLGMWWYIADGGSYTTERLAQLVAEREAAA